MRIILLISIIISFSGFSQETFYVKDGLTEKSIPFVKVIPSNGSPFLSDIDGAINIDDNISSFLLHYSGYRDTLIDKNEVSDSIIYMELNVQDIQEMVVLPGENPAHRIMSQAIKNRKENHPLKNDAFTYSSYSKFIFDVNPESIASISDTTTDSTLIEFRSFFDAQHLFILESSSDRTFTPPYRDVEEITAYKVSGFSNPMFSTFANSMQSFSFYDVQFDLLGEKYINPLATGGLRRYLFILEDTTFNQTDTTYTIYYRPRKGKSFNGMEGRMYINTNGFAIEKVIAKPYQDTTGMSIEIIQEYEFIDNYKWFPVKLSTSVDFGEMGSINGKEDGIQANLIGSGSSYIEKIKINPKNLKKKPNNNISIYTAEDANELDDNKWDSLRRYSITDKETRTYEMIDSLSEAENLDYKLGLLTSLLEGKIPLGNYNFNLDRLFDFNQYEGFRLGGGLETSNKMMKNVVIGGYGAWGFKDKEWKYGGQSTIHLIKKKGMKINLIYQQDLLERGGYSYVNQGFNVNDQSLYRDFFITNMEKQRLGEVSFSVDLKSNISLRLFGNYQRIWFTEDYQFSPIDTDILSSDKDLDLAETGIELQWNILEKNMMLGNKKVSLGTKFPRIKIKAVKGWKDWFESDFEYYRLNAEITHDFSLTGIGQFYWKIEGGTTIGESPLFLNHVGNGTGLNWSISANQTFQTMAPSEFYSTSQAALFTHFTFRALKTKAKWNEPRLTLHHAIGYGELSGKEQHSASFRTMDKGFYEGGLILDGILIMNTSAFGIGGFYRYGYYSDSDWKNNIYPKISVSFTVN